MSVRVAKSAGFCFGVNRAVELVQSAAAAGKRTLTLGPIIHNRHVVEQFRKDGIGVIDTPEQARPGDTVIIRSHGVSRQVFERLTATGAEVIDATCPFVARVHQAASEFASRGLQVVVIGHPDHAEVKGITGEVPDPIVINDSSYTSLATAKRPLGVVSQTTMNADDVAAVVERLRQTFVVESTAEVCRATKERQDAVKAFDGDALLVLGSAQSSNTKRLCEVAHCRTFRAGTMADLRDIDFSGIGRLGVTSGASTPEEFFSQAVDWLRTQEDT